MAILDSFDGNTRTGNGFFTRAANWVSFLPFGFLQAPIQSTLGFIGTIVETAGHLLRLRVGSAATALVAGTVGNMVNLAEGTLLAPVKEARWWINTLSGVTTGASMGTHARKLTEEAIGAVTGWLGVKPQILQSHPVGIGYLNPNYFPQAMGLPALPQAGVPGRFATMEAQRRGQDPVAYHRSRMGSEDMRDHVAALEAARAQQPQLRQAV
jgi:hypothetical protein